jgi:hypothetical protein
MLTEHLTRADVVKARLGAEQVNSTNEGATLSVWTEVIGTIHELSANDSYVCVQIGNKLLCFPLKSQEAEILLRKLNKELRGRKVGLFRTDDRIKPLLVRLIDI